MSLNVDDTDNKCFNDIECSDEFMSNQLKDLEIEYSLDRPNFDMVSNSNSYNSEFNRFPFNKDTIDEEEKLNEIVDCRSEDANENFNSEAFSNIRNSHEIDNQNENDIIDQTCQPYDSFNDLQYCSPTDDSKANDLFFDDDYDLLKNDKKNDVIDQIYQPYDSSNDMQYCSTIDNSNTNDCFYANDYDLLKKDKNSDCENMYSQFGDVSKQKEFNDHESFEYETSRENQRSWTDEVDFTISKDESNVIIKSDCGDVNTQSKSDYWKEKMNDGKSESCIDSQEMNNKHEKEVSESEKNGLKVSSEKSKIVTKIGVQAPSASVCHVCSKRVYPVEQLLMDSKCYHKSCFKCQKCGTSLRAAAASTLNGNVFCKPHYIELFRKRGRYEDICIGGEDTTDRVFVTSPRFSETKFRDSEDKSRKYSSSFSGFPHLSGDIPRNDSASEKLKFDLDSDSCSRVANTRRAWAEGRINNASESKGNHINSNNNNTNEIVERRSIKMSGKIRDMAAIFESNQ